MLKRMTLFTVVALVASLAFPEWQGGELEAQGQQQMFAWSPKPVSPAPYTGPHRPHTRISEVLEKYDGRDSWRHLVVDDSDIVAEYISMAPGESTIRKFYGDNPAFWVIQSGEVRFHIDGIEPFVATEGYLVQVPYRVPFWMETVGNEPSVRFEVRVQGALPLYPEDVTPPDLEPQISGMDYYRIRSPVGSYDEDTQPYLDFIGDVVNGDAGGGAFVYDDRLFANIIRGQAQQRPPDTNLGHMHTYGGEFWYVLEGEIDYLIEGLEFFSAEVGDIVYVPQGRWHRATYGGDGMATRLAINPYPRGLHSWPSPPEGADDGWR